MCNQHGKPVAFLLSEGQMSDDHGAALLFASLPKARCMLADKGYDSNWFRNALQSKGVLPCIPSKANRRQPMPYDKILYQQRHKVENLFARLKDWRRIHTRYDRCAHTFFSAICLAATVTFYLN